MLAGAEPAEPELPVLELAGDSQADQQPSPALAMLPELEPVSLPELEPGWRLCLFRNLSRKLYLWW